LNLTYVTIPKLSIKEAFKNVHIAIGVLGSLLHIADEKSVGESTSISLITSFMIALAGVYIAEVIFSAKVFTCVDNLPSFFLIPR
jgi:hypothetical protein